MAITVTDFANNFGKGWKQSLDTSLRNFADVAVVDMKKHAPFDRKRKSGQHLIQTIQVVRTGDRAYMIVSTKPYAIRRNFENNLHPQTKHYIENGVSDALKGKNEQWWYAIK